MSTTRVFAIIVFGLIVVAILTNPGKEKLEGAVATKAKDILQKQLNYEHSDAVQLGMTLFGDRLVRQLVEQHVTVTNYYVFSTVRIRWQGDESPIGGGAFGTVWLSPEIDNKVDEIVAVIKQL